MKLPRSIEAIYNGHEGQMCETKLAHAIAHEACRLQREADLARAGALEFFKNTPLVVEKSLYKCSVCLSTGFEPSITGHGCSFCDGTEGGNPP